MADFPRTNVGGLSVSRLVIGTNWFLGFSHTTAAKTRFIKGHMTPERIADILEVFLREGVDTLIGIRPSPELEEALKRAEDRAGRGLITIGAPTFNVTEDPGARDENLRLADDYAALECNILMPHQATTDALLDRTTRTIRRIGEFTEMTRERGMIPGLSTHMPETIVYADESGADVETYLQIYNAAGFLMQVEIEWVHRIIHEANKPVLTIKPMAAGRLTPFVGLNFSWATIRECDMVAAGTMTPDEAKEVIEISRSAIERRPAEMEYQKTRSKASIERE